MMNADSNALYNEVLNVNLATSGLIDSSDRNKSYYLIADNGKYIKVSQAVYFILKCSNENKTVEEIAELATRISSKPISTVDVVEFQKSISAKLKKISEDENSQKRTGFWFLWEWISPKQVQKIVNPLSILYNPIISKIVILLIIAGLYTSIMQGVFLASSADILSARDFWVGYFLFFVSTIFHELGHASAGKRYGSRPSGIGFTIYIMFPTLYSDVTDAWKLKASQRLIVSLGGIYFHLIAATVFSFLYLVTEETFYKIAILMIVFNCVLNLNPFFKFDGYWILGDLLGVVNLEQQKRKILTLIIKRIKGNAEEVSPWARWITLTLVFYTLLSFVFIVFFLVMFLLRSKSVLALFYDNAKTIVSNVYLAKVVSLSELHGLFISLIPIVILMYFLYNFSRYIVFSYWKKNKIQVT